MANANVVVEVASELRAQLQYGDSNVNVDVVSTEQEWNEHGPGFMEKAKRYE